ncbi:MAG: DNA polymerase III subunit delta [Bacilli bacterium]|nr:DNA polymerase III subunit delta [Bacilli bacterium]
MIYLLYGTEDFLIKKELSKIKNKFDINDISEYDLEEVSLKNIIDDASSMSLFSNQRLIILSNCTIFTGSSKKRDDIKYLEDYLHNPNSSTTLVFIVNSESLDNRKKIVSLVKENGKIIEFNSNFDIIKNVKEMFGDYNISQTDIRLLIDRVGNNLSILNNEINKIKTYKDNDYNITSSDIITLTHKTVDIDIFHLIDNIIKNNKKDALDSYYEMIKMGEEPIKIIVMLSNQFRLMYQVKKLSSMRNSIFDMMKILLQKKYTIEKALEKARKYDEKILIKKIYELANLDLKIKSGRINKNIALELFILDK